MSKSIVKSKDNWIPVDQIRIPESSNFGDFEGSTDVDFTNYSTYDHVFNTTGEIVICSIILIICMLGFVGNGTVIWLLGFRMKRNPFTTYILNLAVADLAVLISLVGISIVSGTLIFHNTSCIIFLIVCLFGELFFFTYSVGQFLLAAISIDRCVAVLFPLWHRCYRPPHLSTIVCALIWIISFLSSGIDFTLFMFKILEYSPILYQMTVNAFICAPLMVISTLILFIKMCCKPQQCRRGKLVTVILLTLLFFLIFAFPLNGCCIITFYIGLNVKLLVISQLCAFLNSSVNPVIYFLVGRRQKKGHPRVSMKVALQRVFKEDEYYVQEGKPTAETQL